MQDGVACQQAGQRAREAGVVDVAIDADGVDARLQSRQRGVEGGVQQIERNGVTGLRDALETGQAAGRAWR